MSIWVMLAVGAALAWIAAVVSWAKERRARSWPTIEAKIVEVEPQSRFEGSGRTMTFNLDSDHCLEYEVDGRRYRHVVGDEASASVIGLKVWRKTPRLGPKRVRVDPRDPNSYLAVEEEGAWRYVAMVAAGLTVAAFLTAVA